VSVHVEIDTQSLELQSEQSLFDCATEIGVRVPTSCNKNGKCRECLVEVVEGEELLSPFAPEEAHLRTSFRLACRARVVGTTGTIR
jgi:ferredoxin